MTASTCALIACPECDTLHRARSPGVRGRALCSGCGALLYRSIPHTLDRALALNLAALGLLVIANLFPFLTLRLGGREEVSLLASGAVALFQAGMAEAALLVFATSVLFPLLTTLGTLWLLLPLHFGRRPPAMGAVYRAVVALSPWSLVGVFMLGALVAFVKLLDLAEVLPGPSLFALAAAMVATAAARANLEPSRLWPHAATAGAAARVTGAVAGGAAGRSAAAHGLIACGVCELLVERERAEHACPRCGASLRSRKRNSLQRTLALVIAGWILLIPANLYPVMTVTRFGRGEPNTLLSGVRFLMEEGMWGLGVLVFFASIVVPFTKLAVLSWLLWGVHRGRSGRPRERARLFRFTEVVGAWSMVDVYLVAILTALVGMGLLADVEPGIGVSFFAAVVVITLFAAHSFDPRLIWDRQAGSPATPIGPAHGPRRRHRTL